MELPCCCRCSINSAALSLAPLHSVSFTAISSHPHHNTFHRTASSRRAAFQQVKRARKFAKFQSSEVENKDLRSSDRGLSGEDIASSRGEDERIALGSDERVLPESLEDAVLQSTDSTFAYVSAGGTRAVVELLFPELENLNEEGAQQRLWDLARLFLEELQSRLIPKQLKAVFPDAGSAALLKYQWADSTFKFASLNDRTPVSKEDEIVVLVAPDYQMLANVERIASSLAGENHISPRPLIMWNPRLSSGDVGIGLNVRRMRENFLRTFTNVYTLQPLSAGVIFRSYPGIWQVFFEDKEILGHYSLVKEQLSRPNPDDIDVLLFDGGSNNGNKEPSGLVKAMGIFASFNRFLKSLSK